MVTTLRVPPPQDAPAPTPRRLTPGLGLSDRVFRGGMSVSGLIVLAVMVAVGLFLLLEATDALRVTGFSFVTTAEWQPDRGEFGIAAVLTGTVMIALVAIAISLPMALGTSLFITSIAPPRARSTLIALVDLMAAVPSVVYGLWGLYFLQGRTIGLSRWLSKWFGWIPIFQVDGADHGNPLAASSVYTASTFIAGIVVAMMVMPIQCSIMREVFSQLPPGEREGALALGATRWAMIRNVALPFARGGIIGGTMLGLGRAMGETIAVFLIISPRFDINFNILEAGANSVAALIALRHGESSGFGLSALFAAGLALFVLTLIINFSASAVVARSRSGAMSEA
ncbi:MAG: phosphate ABC transporter permease subunit PstC [Acidimicrobiia bacterium]